MNTSGLFAYIALFMLLPILSPGQEDILGKWISVDDQTGEKKSIVEIFTRNGKVFGKIVKLLDPPPDNPDPVCDQCKDHRKNAPILGMEIITDMRKDGDRWSKGKILDPENGRVYRCQMWVEAGNLKVRGYVGFFYRTQTWPGGE